MREFFHGWRRKVGCVTLVMACALTIGWMRSVTKCDEVRIPVKNGVVVGMVSGASSVGIHWGIDNGLRYPEVWSIEASESPGSCLMDLGWRVRGDLLGFGFVYIPGDRSSLWAVPYILMVLPLAILSAYLILWKPRRVK